MRDVIIIGAGPIGLFAAFQAGMLGMSSCLIDALPFVGGQCSALYPEKPIYDIPGYPEISGQSLIDNLQDQAKPFNPKYLLEQEVVDLVMDDGYFVITTSKNIVRGKVVLIAAGSGCFGPNRLPLADIKTYEGKSVFYSVQKREDFIGKKILIAGGGDSAIDWAINLSNIAEVTLVHRRSKFRAAHANIEKVFDLASSGKIRLITNYQISGLNGSNGILESVEISDLDKKTQYIKTDILLPFFGLSQNLGSIAKFGLDIRNNKIISNYPHFETNINGIYAVGDIATYDGKLKLILTGFAEVSSALHHAYARVFDGKALHFQYSTSKGINKNHKKI